MTSVVRYNLINSKKLFWSFVYLTVFLLVVYVGLIGFTVFDLVIYDKMQENLSKLAAEITALEEQYLEFSNQISLKQAHLLGFVDVGKTYFLRADGELLTARIDADNRQ